MSDTYTKVVLTVIAVALVALVFQRSTPLATAQSDGCGTSRKPCYVMNSPADPLYVTQGSAINLPRAYPPPSRTPDYKPRDSE